jgi:hypothetical protein
VGYIDQAVTIHNDGEVAIAPKLSFAAVGPDGQTLPDVAISTAFGSDVGRLVVPPGESVEILAFRGQDADKVSDVTVVTQEVFEVEAPDLDVPVEAQGIGENGETVELPAAFRTVLLTNNNADPAAVRVVYLAYDTPASGESQQASAVIQVAESVMVPGNGTVEVPVAESVARRLRGLPPGPASLKAHQTRS